jgi:hypothetical protein
MEKNQIITMYAAYRFEDIEIEEQAQMLKANNAALSPTIRRDALDCLEVIELIKEVYMTAAQQGVNILGMRFDLAFQYATGQTLDRYKDRGIVGSAWSGVDRGIDVSVGVMRTGLNRFGQWLSSKTAK